MHNKEGGINLALDEMSPEELFHVFCGGLAAEGPQSLMRSDGLANQAAHVAEAQYRTAVAMDYPDVAAWNGLRAVIVDRHAVAHAQMRNGLSA